MPDLAILIKPDINFRYEKASAKDVQIGNLEYGIIKEKYEVEFNTNLVRSAESAVFCNNKQDWVEKLVTENREWHTESINDDLPVDGGHMIISRDRPRKRV